jgi:hypothetical protein
MTSVLPESKNNSKAPYTSEPSSPYTHTTMDREVLPRNGSVTAAHSLDSEKLRIC